MNRLGMAEKRSSPTAIEAELEWSSSRHSSGESPGSVKQQFLEKFARRSPRPDANPHIRGACPALFE
jgi:hypothetical protein